VAPLVRRLKDMTRSGEGDDALEAACVLHPAEIMAMVATNMSLIMEDIVMIPNAGGREAGRCIDAYLGHECHAQTRYIQWVCNWSSTGR
jgi:hypothetical protein